MPWNRGRSRKEVPQGVRPIRARWRACVPAPWRSGVNGSRRREWSTSFPHGSGRRTALAPGRPLWETPIERRSPPEHGFLRLRGRLPVTATVASDPITSSASWRRVRSSSSGRRSSWGFALDTVFVVRGRQRDIHATNIPVHRLPRTGCEPSFSNRCAIRANPRTRLFRLYRGRRYNEAPNGPYSFVPCRPYGVGRMDFPRPIVRLPHRWIGPKLAMAAKATPATRTELEGLWEEVVRQVSAAGLAMGVQLDPAPELTAEEEVDGRAIGESGSAQWRSGPGPRADATSSTWPVRIPDEQGPSMPEPWPVSGGRPMVVQPTSPNRGAAMTSSATRVPTRGLNGRSDGGRCSTALLITINQLYQDDMTAEELYRRPPGASGCSARGGSRFGTRSLSIRGSSARCIESIGGCLPEPCRTEAGLTLPPIAEAGGGSSKARWRATFAGSATSGIRSAKAAENPIRYVNA